MNATPLDRALEPVRPGPTVRLLGPILPGVRRTADQIVEYSACWRDDALAAIDGDGPVLVVFGDSLAQGIGARRRAEGFASIVARAAGNAAGQPVAVVNLSRSGARIRDVLEVQIPAFRAIDPDRWHRRLIGGVCTIGSNDLVRSPRFGRTRDRMSELIGQLPPDVCIATLPDVGSVLAKRLNRHVRREAVQGNRPIADVAEALTSWRGLMAGDGFHPNDDGHRLWADVISTAILSSMDHTAKPVRRSAGERRGHPDLRERLG